MIRASVERIARSALRAYGLEHATLTPISTSENTVFAVEDGSGSFVLRVPRPGRSVAAVDDEVRWLDALRQETDLLVPEPVPTRAGTLVVTVEAAPGDRQPAAEPAASYPCVLFRRLQGDLLGDSPLTPDLMAELGAVMARLHRHAATLPADVGRARGRIGAGSFGPDQVHAGILGSTRLSAAEVAVCRSAYSLVHERLAALGTDRAVFGLIHADLHNFNCLRVGDRLAVIDFDDCALGPFGYDMAVPLAMAAERGDAEFRALREGFFRGYRTTAAVEPRTAALLDTFVAARGLHLVGWLSQNLDNPFLAEWADTFIPHALAGLAGFVGQPRPT